MKMPSRNSTTPENPTLILRRSPRFLLKNQTKTATVPRRSPRFSVKNKIKPQDLQTPVAKQTKSRASLAGSGSFTSSRKGSSKEVQSKKSDVQKVLSESNANEKNKNKESGGVGGISCSVRKSVRLSGKENARLGVSRVRLDEGNDSGKQIVGEGIRRSGKSGNGKRVRVIDCKSSGVSDKDELFGKKNGEVGNDLSKQDVVKTGKCKKGNVGKKTKNSGSCKDVGRSVECSEGGFGKGASVVVTRKPELGVDSTKQGVLDVGEGKEGRGGVKQEKIIGVKRKRDQVGRGHTDCGSFQGWNKDQELALEKAYFAAKPTPHFWKKVAKMVPGKSAQDCFDRINSDQLTPPQHHPRSRAKTTNLSSLSLSASKLLESTEQKIKKPGCRTNKTRVLVQKTMRQLLQKQYQVEQGQNADLFSVFESTLSQSTVASPHGLTFSTPKRDQEKSEFLKRCRERSSSAQRKQLSRFGNSSGATIVSPPVLKQVKNKALHEKYIDQLHVREAKRKAAFAKAAKSSLKIVGKENVQKTNAIQAAKDALLLDARIAINQFQHAQANALNNFGEDDRDDGAFYDIEDESEDIF